MGVAITRLGCARNIALSLTLGAWDADTLVLHLKRRLPVPLRPLSTQIAAQLIAELPGRYAPSAKRVAQSLLHCEAFERVYAFCQKHGLWPDPDLTTPAMAPVAALAQVDIPQLPTARHLADWLMVPVARLDYLADLHARFEENGETSINHYHYVLQPKTTAGVRLIEAPKQGLKAVQRQILRGIVDRVPPHRDAFGFVAGRNCLQAARRHAGEQVVLCFDLKDFFPSVGAGRVFGLFRCLGYPHNVARYLTALCTTATPPRILHRLGTELRPTYRGPHLPQGAPSSPALANHVAFSLDCRLAALARRLGAQYSRYADDLSFSGDTATIGALMRAVPQVVREEGFRLNAAKTRVMPMTSRQVVTGVVVNQHLNIDRAAFDRLKAIIHACARRDDGRLNDPAFRAHLQGRVGWVERVNPNRGHKLRRMLERAEGLADAGG